MFCFCKSVILANGGSFDDIIVLIILLYKSEKSMLFNGGYSPVGHCFATDRVVGIKVLQEDDMQRCSWVNEDKLMIRYHDEEWGVPTYDDRKLFEMLLLEGMQAGLSWITILKKRENFRQALDGFDACKIAHYNDVKVGELMANPGIIRNHLKIKAAIENAWKFLAIQEQQGSFSRFIWQFVAGKPRLNRWATADEVPATTKESDAMSKALRKLGFKFVGSTICYSFMQATGMVNDHTENCFLFDKSTR